MSKNKSTRILVGTKFFLTVSACFLASTVTDVLAATAQAGSSKTGTAMNSVVNAAKDMLAGSGGQLMILIAVASAVMAGGFFSQGGTGFNKAAVMGGVAGTAALVGYGVAVAEKVGGLSALI